MLETENMEPIVEVGPMTQIQANKAKKMFDRLVSKGGFNGFSSKSQRRQGTDFFILSVYSEENVVNRDMESMFNWVPQLYEEVVGDRPRYMTLNI